MSTGDTLIATGDELGDALFGSVDAALRFVFGFDKDSPINDTLAALMRRRVPYGGRDWLDAVSQAGQAGALRARLSSLSATRMAVLAVRFAPRSVPCACRSACCSGHASNPEYEAAVAQLTVDGAAVLAGSLSQRQLREGCVRRWAGEKRNLNLLAEKVGCAPNTAGRQNKILSKWLSATYTQSIHEADRLLRQHLAADAPAPALDVMEDSIAE